MTTWFGDVLFGGGPFGRGRVCPSSQGVWRGGVGDGGTRVRDPGPFGHVELLKAELTGILAEGDEVDNCVENMSGHLLSR